MFHSSFPTELVQVGIVGGVALRLANTNRM